MIDQKPMPHKVFRNGTDATEVWVPNPEAYETLLLDIFAGDATSFVRAVLEVWNSTQPNDFPNYSAGSWGPKAADELLEKDGKSWLLHG